VFITTLITLYGKIITYSKEFINPSEIEKKLIQKNSFKIILKITQLIIPKEINIDLQKTGIFLFLKIPKAKIIIIDVDLIIKPISPVELNNIARTMDTIIKTLKPAGIPEIKKYWRIRKVCSQKRKHREYC